MTKQLLPCKAMQVSGSLFVLICVLAFGISPSRSEAAETRVALVIGNSNYEWATKLANPGNDAREMTTALQRLGFGVIQGTDLDHNGMRRKLKEFSARLQHSDVALFFYAGHALQVNGSNYLIPIDTRLEQESDLEFETISLDFVLQQMEKSARTSIALLDACRDNPLARRFVKAGRSTGRTRGLVRPEMSPQGTLIAFATQPGNVALDGNGQNSPFTTAILKNIERPNVEISSLMTDIRRDVYEDTDRHQLPWTSSSLIGRFYFKERPTASSAEIPKSEIAALSPELNRPNENNRPHTPVPDFKEFSLSREYIQFVQSELNRVGCAAGPIDGMWGPKGKRALARFFEHTESQPTSTQLDRQTLTNLSAAKTNVCPKECGIRFRLVANECVLKTCTAGQRLASNGKCVAASSSSASNLRSKNGCFLFNGITVCD